MNSDVSFDEVVGDASSAVYVGTFHDYAIFYLSVSNGYIDANTCERPDAGVGAYLAVVSDDGRASDGIPAVEHQCFIFSGSIYPLAVIAFSSRLL